jgi:hypothetical protein
MLVLFAPLGHLPTGLQKSSIFGQNSPILHPNRTHQRTARLPCGHLWCPSRSPVAVVCGPSSIVHRRACPERSEGSAVPPSSVLILPSFFHVGVLWGSSPYKHLLEPQKYAQTTLKLAPSRPQTDTLRHQNRHFSHSVPELSSPCNS